MGELYRGVEDLVGWEEERKVRWEDWGLDGKIISRCNLVGWEEERKVRGEGEKKNNTDYDE